MGNDRSERKRLGAWYTPEHLVDAVVTGVVDPAFVTARSPSTLRILDPACGDGRFLRAVVDAVHAVGGHATALGVDIDPDCVAALTSTPDIEYMCADALSAPALTDRAGTFDLVIGNPPYLSQLAAATTRGGSSARGGGPYADAAVEFLALAAELVDPDGGRVALVLPQSILSARDAGDVRAGIDRVATMFWSAWTGERDFDAQVVTCALGFEFRRSDVDSASSSASGSGSSWSHVVTARTGVPAVPSVFDVVHPPAGRLGDRARLNANFRDEYYGMIAAVDDHDAGPPLVTSGLIDPGRCRWSERSVRFAKRRFDAPRLDLSALDTKMRSWADQRLVPKVLVANQTPIVEAVCDPDGAWLPGVPVVAAYPLDTAMAVEHAWQIAAVLCAPSVSVWAWHRRGGTGLSSSTLRLGPTMLADLPWPEGDLGPAVEALRRGDVVACGGLVDVAYGLTADEREDASRWWRPTFDRVSERSV